MSVRHDRLTLRRDGRWLGLLIALSACHTALPYSGSSSDGGADARPIDVGPDAAADVSAPDLTPPDSLRPDLTQPDLSPPPDATVPVCRKDEVECGGMCAPGFTCIECPGAPLLCPATRRCVADCTGCQASGVLQPIACFACKTNDAFDKSTIGTCEAAGPGYCLDGDYGTAYRGGPGARCDCSDTEVKNCPGDDQVCVPKGSDDECITCGEQGAGTDGLPCKGGGTCRTALSPPSCV